MILKLIPTLLAIFKRGTVLYGATKSSTTRVQWVALFICAILVAAVGYFLPAFASEEIQTGLLLAALAALGPLVSRYLGYQTPVVLSDAAAGVMLDRVKSKNVRSWFPFCGGILDAREEGWELGADKDNVIWDVKTGERTGDVIETRKGTLAESDAVVAKVKAAIEGNKGKRWDKQP